MVQLDENGVAEEDNRRWGTLVVLSENTPGKRATKRLTVEPVCFLPILNRFTCPFAFPIPCCDDTVQDTNTEEKYFIDVDIYSGY